MADKNYETHLRSQQHLQSRQDLQILIFARFEEKIRMNINAAIHHNRQFRHQWE